MDTELNVVNPGDRFNKVSLIPPTKNSYLLIAAEIDTGILPFTLWQSKKKDMIIAEAKKWCLMLREMRGVISAVVFKSVIIPPGKGALLQERKNIHNARFDITILIESIDKEIIKEILSGETYISFKTLLATTSKYTYLTQASNVKRIGHVDHHNKGIYLFNYFFGDSYSQNLAVWEYTAGWFQQVTGLNNSTVLAPDEPDISVYTLINHCRWDTIYDILPSLLFSRSFRTFVLANFYANNVAPMPVLYRMA